MADNGEDGVAEALREKPDQVILDLNLPGILARKWPTRRNNWGFFQRRR